MELTFSNAEIFSTASQLWQHGSGFKVWAFHGEMGSGKTTFIHALCEILGVASAIGSPTYAIINEYKAAAIPIIYHMDWYRLKDEEEAIQAGVEDSLYSNELCLIEWPDKAPGLLPQQTLHLYLSVVDNHHRSLYVPALTPPLA